MPAWKIEYDEADRWKLVHYIRTMFTQTEDRPPAPPEETEFFFPDLYKTLSIPASASFERGRQLYAQQCAHCHGLAGDGAGWDGEYLDPQPADFREMAGKEMSQEEQGAHLARVTFGIQDTAMPSWGEFLTEDQRWDVVKYLMQAFMMGKPVTTSVVGNGEMAANYVLASSEVYLAEGHSISVTHGADLYPIYCATCHGERGEGNGPGTVGNASMGPAAFPQDMTEAYIFWRTWDGVPDSTMGPFRWLLSDEEVWDLTMYLQSKPFGGGGQ
jgi:mono/diheme cytochrome c family protein